MNQTKPSVSVIVPVYNVERYLAECVNSILGQTFEDFEILLVDDGSTDSSPVICDEYAAYDSRVRVIHKSNGGLSDARNAGIDAARADILSFIDSDDVVHSHMLEVLLIPILGANEIDASVCAYRRFSDSDELDTTNLYGFTTDDVSSEVALERIYANTPANFGFVAWNKVYRRTLFESTGIRYPVGRIHEDDFTTYKLLYAARNVELVDAELYFYRMREGSIMSGSSHIDEHSIDAIDARREAYEFFKDKEQPLALASAKSLLRSCMEIWALSTSSGFGLTAKQIAMETYRKTWKESVTLFKGEPKKKFAYGLFPKLPKTMSQIILG
jgi:glycosyltransferase involved in cell wall biosynthesis